MQRHEVHVPRLRRVGARVVLPVRMAKVVRPGMPFMHPRKLQHLQHGDDARHRPAMHKVLNLAQAVHPLHHKLVAPNDGEALQDLTIDLVELSGRLLRRAPPLLSCAGRLGVVTPLLLHRASSSDVPCPLSKVEQPPPDTKCVPSAMPRARRPLTWYSLCIAAASQASPAKRAKGGSQRN